MSFLVRSVMVLSMAFLLVADEGNDGFLQTDRMIGLSLVHSANHAM